MTAPLDPAPRRREALMFVCPWLTDAEVDAVLAGEDEQGPTFVERLAHHETEHREWMHLAMELWREATGSEAPWPGSAKAIAAVQAARAAWAAHGEARARYDHLAGRVLFFCAVTGDGQTPEQAIESHFATDPKRHAEPLADEELRGVRALSTPAAVSAKDPNDG